MVSNNIVNFIIDEDCFRNGLNHVREMEDSYYRDFVRDKLVVRA